jgi:hypothetical protein
MGRIGSFLLRVSFTTITIVIKRKIISDRVIAELLKVYTSLYSLTRFLGFINFQVGPDRSQLTNKILARRVLFILSFWLGVKEEKYIKITSMPPMYSKNKIKLNQENDVILRYKAVIRDNKIILRFRNMGEVRVIIRYKQDKIRIHIYKGTLRLLL